MIVLPFSPVIRAAWSSHAIVAQKWEGGKVAIMPIRTLKAIQQRQDFQRKLKYWFAWSAWIPATLTLILAIVDALGYLSPTWGKWIVVVIALLSVGILLTAIPEKDQITKQKDRMKSR